MLHYITEGPDRARALRLHAAGGHGDHRARAGAEVAGGHDSRV